MEKSREDEDSMTNAAPLVIEYSKLAPSGEALEIGAGRGDNAIYLAKQGFSVTAIEFNRNLADFINKKAEKNHLLIKVEECDLRDYPVKDSFFSFISAINVLHFLSETDFEKIIRNIKNSLIEGGIVVISCITDDDPLAQELRDIAAKENREVLIDKNGNERYFPAKGELLTYFEKYFEILFYVETEVNDKGHPKHLKPHIHRIARLAARKK